MVVNEISDFEFIAEQAGAFLQEGPLTLDALIDRLEAAGLRLGDDPRDLLFDLLGDDCTPIGDWWVHLPSLLHGIRWVVDVPAEPGDALPLGVLASVVVFWDWQTTPLLDGTGTATGEVRHGGPSRYELLGPVGWLTEMAGRRAVLEYRRDGVRVSPASADVEVDLTMASALRDAFDAEARLVDDPFADAEAEDVPPFRLAEFSFVSLRAFTEQPDVFRSGVLADSTALAAAAGLELAPDSDECMPAGTDQQALRAARRFHGLRSHYELSDDDTQLLMMVLGGASQILGGVPDPFGADDPRGGAFVLSMALARPAVCRAFVHESLERERDEHDLVRVAGALLEHVGGGPGCSGPEVVQAIALDRLGHGDDARAALERAVAHEPNPMALRMLAGWAADRGEAAEAARLLRAAGVTPDDDGAGGSLWAEIEPFLQRPRTSTGRNDPCPCGSGKKYKACHLGREQHPLVDRAAWLYRKAIRFVNDVEPAVHAKVAFAIVDAAGGGDELLQQVLETELVYDVVLHEAGMFREFLDRRRSVLPADELELAALWVLSDRVVLHVDEVGPDWAAFTVVGTDEQVRVGRIRGARMRAGGYLLARLVQGGDGPASFFGYVPVPQQMVDDLVDVLDGSDPLEVAEAIGLCFAPEHWADLER